MSEAGALTYLALGDSYTIGEGVAEAGRWPLQLARADRWCGPGWALAGDAAHNVHPLAGHGLNLGLVDAGELAKVLHEREYWRSPGDVRLLRRYERARKGDMLAMGAYSHSRLRQLILGGVTRHVLENSNLPVMMNR